MSDSATVLLARLLARGKFRHLQVLLKLAELGSLQRTAGAIGLTQSSITQTLAYLEALLDTPLFERHARGVRPTAACRDLLPIARQLMAGLAVGADIVTARRRSARSTLRLLASVSATHGLLAGALPGFAARHPAIGVQLTETEGDDQLLAIARGECDLVVCRRPAVVPEGWTFVLLAEDRLAVLCGSAHPLARARRVTMADLSAQLWLLSPSGTAARAGFDRLALSFSMAPRVHPIVTRSPTMLWWLLRQEPVLALLPFSFALPTLQAGEVREVVVRLDSPMEPLGLLRPSVETTDAAEALIGHLQTQAKRLRTGPTGHAGRAGDPVRPGARHPANDDGGRA